MHLRIGTRGSKLALAQTDWVISRLKSCLQDLEVEKIIIKTTGDKILDSPLSSIGGKGLFVKEIEEALLRDVIDLAVHSMKDVPSQVPDELEVTIIPERESPFDVWVSEIGGPFELSPQAKVGTSSLRRSVQLKRLRMDFDIVGLRGNVDTRLRKLKEGQYQAIVLAEAGLRRLGLNVSYRTFTLDEMIPAVGQGALGIEIRKEDKKLKDVLSQHLHSPETALCVSAERAFLLVMEGGCQVPLGAHAYLSNGTFKMVGFISDLAAERFYKRSIQGPKEDATKLGERLAKELLAIGGMEILKELR